MLSGARRDTGDPFTEGCMGDDGSSGAVIDRGVPIWKKNRQRQMGDRHATHSEVQTWIQKRVFEASLLFRSQQTRT